MNKRENLDQLEALVQLPSEQSRMTDWEIDFVEDLDRRVRRGLILTVDQISKLVEVYDTHILRKRRSSVAVRL